MRHLLRRTAMLTLGLTCAACSSAPDPRIEAARSYAREVTGDDLKVQGLRVTMRKAVADGRYIRLSAMVENRYEEPVDGVRYTIHLIAPGQPPKVVETIREQRDTRLAPGEDRAVRFEIESPVRASASGGAVIEAQPVRLGEKTLPAPEGWEASR